MAAGRPGCLASSYLQRYRFRPADVWGLFSAVLIDRGAVTGGVAGVEVSSYVEEQASGRVVRAIVGRPEPGFAVVA